MGSYSGLASSLISKPSIDSAAAAAGAGGGMRAAVSSSDESLSVHATQGKAQIAPCSNCYEIWSSDF